jgi:hypothetical protein
MRGDECDAKYYYLYSDSNLSSEWSGPTMELTAADEVTPGVPSVGLQLLNVNTAAPFKETAYLKGMNRGK